jgi:peptide/nickel transport system substrate-binding protein
MCQSYRPETDRRQTALQRVAVAARAVNLPRHLATTAIGASAETLRWARAGDSLTLDPHAQNEGPTHTLAHQIYEPLIIRDMSGAFQPALATDWAPSPDDPNVWVFNLREGVTFHDGADFTAEDVVFSINRAMSEDSDMKELLTSIVEVRAVDDHTVEFVTDGPNPLLPSNLTNLFMMDKGWAEANGAGDVQDMDGRRRHLCRDAMPTAPAPLFWSAASPMCAPC